MKLPGFLTLKLPSFLTRKKDEDDDEDFEDFEDDEPKTRVIEDEVEPEFPAAAPDQNDEALDVDDMPSEMSEDEDSADVEDIPAFDGDDDDVDFDDDDEEDDENDESDEDGGSGPPILFIVLGAVVLLGGVLGGATFWFLNSGDDADVTVAQSSGSGKSVGMALPPITKKPLSPQGTGLQATGQKNGADGPAPAAAPAPVSAISALGAGGLNARAGASAGPRQGLIIPSVTGVSYQAIPDQSKVTPLASAPDKALVEEVNGLAGKLPVISRDGRKAWEVYARPPTATGSNPRLAIVVTGLGLSRAATIAAIKKLPGDVSLAFSPYARDLNDWLLRARLAGHEVFLELPMESKGFPEQDAGPLSLNSNLQVADNIRRLTEIMSRMEGYVGLMSVLGSKFMDAEGQLKPVLEEINKRGLMFVDGTGGRTAAPKIAAEIGLAKAFVNVALDDPPEPQSLNRKLKSLESILKKQPVAVAVIHAYPSTLRRLNIWLKSIEERKMSLVPLTAVADKQIVE